MRKYFFAFVISVIFLFLSAVSVSAQQTTVTGEHIEGFDTKITINTDGKMDITETILYDFGDYSRHGIYRNIPFIKTNKAGKKFKLDITNFQIVDENDVSYMFNQSTVDSSVKLKIGDPDKTITGQHTYVISYTISGALTYFSDHDELYWNCTGNDWTVPITKSTCQVVLPGATTQGDVKITCYTGVSGSSSTDCLQTYENGSVKIETQNILQQGEGLTAVVGFPKGAVSVLEPKEYIPFSETPFGRLVILLLVIGLLVIGLLWYVVLPIWIIWKWWSSGRDPSIRSAHSGQVPGVVSAWFDPPKNKQGRFLTPAETGVIVDERVDMKDISALIVDLARRGYLQIVEKKKGDFSFVMKNNPDKSLLDYESQFLTDFFNGEDEVSLKQGDQYETVKEVKVAIYNLLVKDGAFPENPDKVRTFYYVLAGLGLFTVNIPLAFLAFIFAPAMPKKTSLGVEQALVAKSLRNFLQSQDRQLEFQAKKQMLFEKLLPYAIAFGVEKIWADRFKNINLKQPEWYQGYYGNHFNSYLLVHSLNSSFHSISTAATPTQSSSGFSSGSSGGFSGGGGGGGGGGSW